MVHVALVPYIAYLMCRHRSLTQFTAANPGIASGGALGESKADSLRHLAAAHGAVADYLLVDPCVDPHETRAHILRWRRRLGVRFPLIAKPDTGEQGWGVASIASERALARYLSAASRPVLLQRCIAGREYGIFYVRRPDDSAGRIVSIAEVRYAATGAAGERYRCKLRVYSDGRHLTSRTLERRIDELAKLHPGFHFGRFDVVAASAGALRRGRLTVIEVNGALAVPLHVYDPRVPLSDRLRSLRCAWRDVFEIAAVNRQRGAKPLGASEFARRLRTRFLRQSDAMTAIAAIRRRLPGAAAISPEGAPARPARVSRPATRSSSAPAGPP